MKILFIAQNQLWPLTTGARIRNYYLARGLTRGAQVTYVQILGPEDEDAPCPPECAFERIVTVRRTNSYTGVNLFRGLVGPWPVSVLGFGSRGVRAAIANLVQAENFDAVQLESIHLSVYLDLLRGVPAAPVLFCDWHNIESELMARYADATRNPLRKSVARRTAHLLDKVEQRTLKMADATAVPSGRERERLLAHSPSANVYVVANGVDTSYYSPQENNCNAERGLSPLVLFVGSMDYHANVDAVTWFVHKVWPTIHVRHPSVEFAIVGRNPILAVRKLASNRILVTGTVADVRPFYRRALTVVAPLQVGGGTRLKILEAMSAAVPVVSTSVGAEGIDAEDEKHLLVADNAEQMVAALERLLASGVERRRLAMAARTLVLQQYDWRAIGANLLSIHRELLESRDAGRSKVWDSHDTATIERDH